MRKIIPFIVGLVFMSVGGFLLYQNSISMLLDWHKMRSWQEQSAQLLSVKINESSVEAKYNYYINNIRYQNERVYLARFNDNIGNYHKVLGKNLQHSFRNKQSISIWINPANPNQAIIDPKMRWGLFALMSLLSGLFFVIGLVILYGLLKKSSSNSGDKQKSIIKGEKHHWKNHKAWKTNKINSSIKSKLWFFWLFCLFWNGITSVVIISATPDIIDEFSKGDYAVLLTLLFPLVGLFLFFLAIKQTIAYWKFGKIQFEMSPYPGEIGNHVGGIIQGTKPLAHDTSIKVTLECVYTYISGTGKSRSRKERVDWAEEGSIKPENLREGFRLRFTFNVPDSLPESDVKRSNTYIFWRLRIKSDMPGVDLNREFDIPVIKTNKLSSESNISNNLSEQYQKNQAEKSVEKQHAIQRGDFHLTDLKDVIHIQEERNLLKLYFPMLRSKFLTLFALIFAGGFGFASYSMLSDMFKSDVSLSGSSLFTIIFSIPFVCVAFFSVIASIQLLFGNFTTRIKRDNVTVWHRLLFIPIRYYQADFKSIKDLSIKRTGSMGQGVNKVEQFKIIAERNNGKKFTIATDIKGEDLANHFKDYLARKVRLMI